MRDSSLRYFHSLGVGLALLAAATQLPAQTGGAVSPQDEIINAERYVLPPEPIRKLVMAPREANVTWGAPSPGNHAYIMRSISDGAPSLAAMSRPYYRLAGWEVDRFGNRARAMTTRNSPALELYRVADGKTSTIQPPAGARITSPTWSPDGNTIAYIANFANATHIYLADPATGKSRALTKTPLLATQVQSYYWTNDGKSLIAVFLPDNRAAEPVPPATALTPRVRVNEDNKLKSRTNPSLLDSPFEMEQYEYFSTGQLGVIDVKSGKVTKVGTPGMIASINPSPDARFFRVSYVEKPLSYYLTAGSFSRTELLIDQTGKVMQKMSERKMSEGVNPDSNPTQQVTQGGGRGAGARGGAAGTGPSAAQIAAQDTAKRSLDWNPIGSGFLYLATSPSPRTPADSAAPASNGQGGRAGAGRGGAGRGGAGQGGAASTATALPPSRRIMQWNAPFDSSSSTVFYTSEGEITSAPRFSTDGKIMFISERALGANGAANTSAPTEQVAIFLNENNARHVYQTSQGSGNGAAGGRAGRGGGAAPAPQGGRGGGAAQGGNNNGTLATTTGQAGSNSIMLSSGGDAVFLRGAISDSGRSRPWIDRVELKTAQRTRLYESKVTDLGETITAPLDNDWNRAIVQRQSAKVPAQSLVLDLKSGQATPITNNRDVTPEITNTIKKEYQAHRADGYTFKVKVTLPSDWKEGQRLPALFWFYPSEFDDQAAYDRGQTTPNPNAPGTFPSTGLRTMSYITQVGYALVEPDAPIFAQNGMLPNDNYVNDLRNDLAAAIDVLDSAGVIIRSQLAIGGHSYGAFSAVNAMVHTPFFKAGIAGDGAYNRTLTPNGFQSERRDFWQGRTTYLEMSPFLYADQLNGALLMYHSIDDQNVGTDPINSLRMYHALQGLGKTVSLYMYPYEDHGPAALETNLDQWGRWVAWLDKYVKGAGRKTATQ